MSAVQVVSPLTYPTWNINVTVPVANSITEVPFQAYIVQSDTNEFICGASILSSLVILTAASCLVGRNGSELTVVAGDSRFYKENESEQRIPVSFIHIYEDFNSNGMNFDYNLAAAFLSSNLTFNRYVKSIDIPLKRWTYEGNWTLSGYGKSAESNSYEDNLHISTIPVISTAECATEWNMDELLSEKYICFYKNGTNASTDLPGGLLTGSVDGVLMLLGVATRRLTKSSELSNEEPRVYTNVAQHRPWIHRMMHHPAILNLKGCSVGETRSDRTFECIPNEFLCEGKDCGIDCEKVNCSSSICNAHGKFYCPSSNQCIPNRLVCDGYASGCPNNEDEVNCSSNNCTETNRFWCSSSSKCISEQFVCDGDKDCTDNEDEMNCSPLNCTENGRIWCSNSSKCIPTRMICNGVDNCGNNEDEMNCSPLNCTENGRFWCSNSTKCIRKSDICDGEDNCGDGEDETNCETSGTCSEGEFKCRHSSKCIRTELTCDGKNDCGNNSDEVICSKQCKEDELECPTSHKCIYSRYFCDGEDDCGNNEDEVNCKQKTVEHTASSENNFNYTPHSSAPARKFDLWSSSGFSNVHLLIGFFERLKEGSKVLNETFLQNHRLLATMKKVLITCDKRRGIKLTELMESLLWKHQMRDEEVQREHEHFFEQQDLEATKDREDTQFFIKLVEKLREEFRRSVKRFQQYHRLLLSLKEGINTCNTQRANMLIELMGTLLQQHRMATEEIKRDYESVTGFMGRISTIGSLEEVSSSEEETE